VVKTTRKQLAFTLVEILIVVIILGILAAIVVPRFANASKDAKRAALASQLNSVRAQIQLYTIEHGDQRPPNLSGANWTDLINPSVYNGTNRGPYIPNVPTNPLNGYSNVAVILADPSWGDAVVGANIGFVYNSNTGFMYGTSVLGDKVFNESSPLDPANEQ
jgi:prepilin-type N-terminal cleavage/methylation domain-containing protein